LGSQQIFRRVVPLLADQYEVITVDLPGHGGSDVPAGAHEMYDAAAEVADTITGLKLKNPIVVGHSWGGYVTAELIASFPQRVGAAAIIYSQPYADPPEKQQARTDAIKRFENEPWDDVVNDLFPVYVADYDPPEIFDEMAAITKEASVEGARFALTTIRDRADRSEAILAHPEIPLLFVSGTDDGAMPPITLQAPHIEHAETHSGHMGPMSAPDDLARILKDWATRLPTAH